MLYIICDENKIFVYNVDAVKGGVVHYSDPHLKQDPKLSWAMLFAMGTRLLSL